MFALREFIATNGTEACQFAGINHSPDNDRLTNNVILICMLMAIHTD